MIYDLKKISHKFTFSQNIKIALAATSRDNETNSKSAKQEQSQVLRKMTVVREMETQVSLSIIMHIKQIIIMYIITHALL